MLVTEMGDELFPSFQSTKVECSGEYNFGSQSPNSLRQFNVDMDCDLPSSEDFLHELSNDLQIPMLLEESNFNEENGILESSSLLNKLNDWGNDSFELTSAFFKEEIKEEPKSPISPLSIDSWQTIESDTKVALETPPISPPETVNCSPPRSPVSETTNQKFHVNEKPVILCNGGNGTIRILPYNNRYCKSIVTNNNVKLDNKKGSKVVLASPGTKIINLQRQTITSDLTSPAPATTLSNGNLDISNARRVLVTSKDISVLTQQNNRINNSLSKMNCVNSATNAVIPVITNQNVPAIKLENTTSKLVPASVKREMQLRVLKRQQRMIKNRESACLSRKRKKEYVTSLESKINDLEKENLELRKENTCLKERLSEMESILTKPKSAFQPNLKKTSMLLAVLLILSVNLGSISLMKRPAPEISVNDMASARHHSRTLLWADNDLSDAPIVVNASSGFPHNPLTCPLHINQTESLRLNSELRRWIGVDEEGLATSEGRTNAVETNEMEKKLKELILSPNLAIASPQPTPQSQFPSPKRKIKKQKKVVKHELQLLSASGQRAGLLEAIRRRDDTFYVVSFSSEHLLLPAIAHNNTLRPKMSLILPALPSNVSANSDEPLTMMQIDCEVLDTRLVEVKEQDIPHHLRTPLRHPSPTPPNVSDSVAVHQEPYRPYFMRAPSEASPSGTFNSNENLNAYSSTSPVYKARLRAFP